MNAYLLYVILSIVMIPGIILGVVAQVKVQSTFNKFSVIQTQRGSTAKAVARKMLNGGGCESTQLAEIGGELTDNYNPKTDTVSLSRPVANQSSVAAIGVAAHEVGHVFQHKQNYVPIKVRSALVPILNVANFFMWPLILLGLLFEVLYAATWCSALIYIGLALYSLSTLFCLVTLPVELNASKRAYKMLVETNELTLEEGKQAKKVLNAAALTYVAALVTSVLSLLRVLLYVLALRGNRRN